MSRLLGAVRRGMPTAIFEDPVPAFVPTVPGTGQPKPAPGSRMTGRGVRTLPKADIRKLWEVLDIQSPGSMGRNGLFLPDVVWQKYNPYPKLKISGIPDQWVFVREEPFEEAGLINPDHIITSGLTELFFPFPGAIAQRPKSDLEFTELATVRNPGGTIGYQQLMEHRDDPAMLRALQRPRENLTLAAVIKSSEDESPQEDPAAPARGAAAPVGAAHQSQSINVIYCADIDLMIPAFLRIRARPEEQQDIRWEFENVTFILNIIDVLAGDTNYVEIRKRKPRYTTLKVVESRVEDARQREFVKRLEFQAKYEKELREAENAKEDTLEKFQSMVSRLQKKQNEGEQVNEVELREKMQRWKEQQEVLNRRLAITKQRLERERDRAIQRIQRDVDLEIQRTQFMYKFLAVAIPWIPPFLVGLVVFVRRRLREREGIEKSRLR
jgi:ABC-2 type transport system permease protein